LTCHTLTTAGKKEKTEEEKKAAREKKRKRQKEKKAAGNKWVEADHSNVYVTGLPFDVTVDELKAVMKKGGIIKEEEDGTPKIKLYKDANGIPKGDGTL
jgi:HIV Tat-specific factor 1